MIVGSIHIQCNLVRCGHIFVVDAQEYLRDYAAAVADSDGSYTFPNRYCPKCEAKAKEHGYHSDREIDETIRTATGVDK